MHQRYLLLVAGLGMVGGCVDARGSFNDFGDRIPDAAVEIDVDGAIVSELPDINGEFLMTVRPDLPEKKLIYLRGTVTLQAVTANTGLLGYTGRFLDLVTMEPIGDELTAEDIEVGSDASFSDVPLAGIMPAAANPITGTNAAVDGVLHGTLITADFTCGIVTGDASGLPLEGTTWAAVRITDTTLPEAVWRCEDQPL